jgi:hypothetical protein
MTILRISSGTASLDKSGLDIFSSEAWSCLPRLTLGTIYRIVGPCK